MKTDARLERARRWGKRAAIAAAGTYVVLLLVVNIVLGVHAVPREITLKPITVRPTFGRAWMWVPGTLHLRDVHVVGRDNARDFELDAARATVTVSLVDLLHHKLHASKVQAENVALHVMERTDAAPLPSLPDAQYDYWATQIDDLDAREIHDASFGAIRFHGDASATAHGLVVRPDRELALGTVTLDAANGTVNVGEDEALDAIACHVDAKIGSFDPRTAPGTDALRFVSANVTGDGHVADLLFSRQIPSSVGKPAPAGGAGAFHADLHVIQGGIVAPSRFNADAKDVSLVANGMHTTSTTKVIVAVEEVSGKPEAEVHVDISNIEVKQVRGEHVLLRAPHVALFARASNLDLTTPFEDTILSFEMPEASIPDLRAIDPFIAFFGVSAQAGSLRLRAKGTVALASMTGTADAMIETDDAVLRFAEGDFHARLIGTLPFKHIDLAKQRADITGSRIDIREAGHVGAKAPLWWSRTDVDDGAITIVKGAPVIRATFSMSASDGRPFEYVMLKDKGLPGLLTKFDHLNDLHGHGDAVVSQKDIVVRNVKLHGGGLDVKAQLDVHGRDEEGVTLVTAGPISIYSSMRNENVEMKLDDATNWYARATATNSP